MKRGAVAVGFLHGGEWSDCFGQSLVDLYLCDAFGSKRIVPNGMQLKDRCAADGLVKGRNEVARKFLDDTDCEWLFMVDADMGFNPDTVDRLLESADPVLRPVVGALCFGLRKDVAGECHGQKYVVVPTVYDFVETDEEVGFRARIDYERDALIEVSATGAACLLVHRTVLHRIREQHGPKWFDHITHPTGPTEFSEDLSFCVRIAAIGFPMYVDTRVRTTHDKGGVFLDELEFDRSIAVHELEQEIKRQRAA